MAYPKLVCPYSTSLLKRIRGRNLGIRLADADLVLSAAEDVRKSGNGLFCVILEIDKPLEAVKLGEGWKELPMALVVPSVGKFRGIASMLSQLKELNVRIYLPCNRDNLTSTRLLASVGISCCVTFDGTPVDWEALADLMTYAVLERTPHAPIEPFSYIARHFEPLSCTDWGAVYFEDPSRFLHLDTDGHVALSQGDIARNNYIAEGVERIGPDTDFAVPADRLDGWREHFVKNSSCATCPGWRVCLGRCYRGDEDVAGCSAFFSEMIRVAQLYQKGRKEKDSQQLWPL